MSQPNKRSGIRSTTTSSGRTVAPAKAATTGAVRAPTPAKTTRSSRSAPASRAADQPLTQPGAGTGNGNGNGTGPRNGGSRGRRVEPARITSVDELFPPFVPDVAGRRGATVATDETPLVSGVLREVLAWSPRTSDSKGFLAALGASFNLEQIQGHVEAQYVPRGFALQADLGAVSGGQASLYARARSGLKEMIPILDGLTALRVDADPEDCEAFRGLVRGELNRLVNELGTPGGPRVARVDAYVAALTGSADPPPTGTTPDTIGGQLGKLREQFGLERDNVNTVDEERIRTAFWTLSDLVTDLATAWSTQRQFFSNRNGLSANNAADDGGFLGTDLVIISRDLAAADDQVYELESVLDSVLIPRSERQTLRLLHGGMTLDDLLQWLHQFLGEEGKTVAMTGGRDGIETSFTPVARDLAELVQANLSVSRSLQQSDRHPLLGTFPPGVYAARTRIAVAGLVRQLKALVRTSARISRFSQPILLDLALEVLDDWVDPAGEGGAGGAGGAGGDGAGGDGSWSGSDEPVRLRITARALNLQPGSQLRLRSDGADLPPIAGTTTSDDDEVTVEYDASTVQYAVEDERRHLTVRIFDSVGNPVTADIVPPAWFHNELTVRKV